MTSFHTKTTSNAMPRINLHYVARTIGVFRV